MNSNNTISLRSEVIQEFYNKSQVAGAKFLQKSCYSLQSSISATMAAIVSVCKDAAFVAAQQLCHLIWAHKRMLPRLLDCTWVAAYWLVCMQMYRDVSAWQAQRISTETPSQRNSSSSKVCYRQAGKNTKKHNVKFALAPQLVATEKVSKYGRQSTKPNQHNNNNNEITTNGLRWMRLWRKFAQCNISSCSDLVACCKNGRLK